MTDLLSGLNPPQREAVVHGDGPLLVLAGAGSGKTRVLTHRVAHLISERSVPPSAILAITFTNKAAGEMRDRLEQLLGGLARAVWAGTFHSTCARILRTHAERVGYSRNFTILDQDDQTRLVRSCLNEAGYDPKAHPPRAVLSAISDAKNRLQSPEQVAAETGSFEDEVVAAIYQRYADRLRASEAVDFDDLLMLAVTLLENDDEVRAGYQGMLQHVLVDEYQDTNHAQYRLVRVLGEPQRNVFVVGDDDQGIYSWRGADVRNILDFERDYPESATIALEQNYRSTGNILAAANAVVENNHDRHPKRLWTDRGDGDPITVLACRDEHEEARAVASEAERRVSEGDSLDGLAVFYRTNAQSRVIEDQLVRRGLPYQVIGGPRFYERAEIRDLMAWLRSAVNPADELSLARLIGAPRRGLGPACLERLRGVAAQSGVPIADVLLMPEHHVGLNTRQRDGLAATGRGLAEIAEANRNGTPLDQIIELALEVSGLTTALAKETGIEAEGRLENLQEVARVSLETGERPDAESPLAGFLEDVALESDGDKVRDGVGQVTLMTIHNAKGLEYPAVMLTGLEEGLFPHSRSETIEALQEERRLCYVGLTRARERLVLSHAESRALHGGRDFRLPSRFLGEIPAECLDAPRPRRSAPRAVTAPPAVTAAPDFTTGDAVVHATFGDGIVTAVEQGGDLVRVRFRQDGAERRLMAGAAPMRKTGE